MVCPGVDPFAVSLAVTLKPVYAVALAVAVTLAEEHVSVFAGLCEQATKLAGKLFRVKLYPASPLPEVTVYTRGLHAEVGEHPVNACP
jgi:hypothetical protein